jgi:hypothetical protein
LKGRSGLQAFAFRQMTTTADATTAESFLRNTQSDGTVFIGRLPQHSVQIDISSTIPLGQVQLKDDPVFAATQMEEKWNVYPFRSDSIFCAELDRDSGSRSQV